MAEIIYIACPLCGMSRVLEKKGSVAIARGEVIPEVKGRIRFDHMDLDKANIIQFRERRRGKESEPRQGRGGGPGFQLMGGLTLAELRDNAEYADLRDQMVESARKIISILEGGHHE